MKNTLHARIAGLALASLLAAALVLAVGLGGSAAPATAESAFVTKSPTVSGTRQVGKTLTVTVATWSPRPTTTNYRWYRDGQPIDGATHASYTLTSRDYGTTVVAKVAGHRTGYATAARGTIVGAIAKAPGAVLTSRPIVEGIARAGVTLTLTKGSWSLSNLSYAYSWFRNGVAIHGATTQHYKVGSLDIGQRLSGHVTVQKTGYAASAAASAETAPGARALVAFSGDGVKKVGRDVAPGVYYTYPDQTGICDYGRLRSATPGDFVNDGDGLPFDTSVLNGQALMNVRAKDTYIETTGCGQWHRISSAGPARSIIPGEGMWKVGTQITPGTYQVTVPSNSYGCDFGTLHDSEWNEINHEGFKHRGFIATLTVKSTDFAVKSYGCGTWTRIK
ncbi:immunoglobulin domain-containing protein [Frondihabitans sp. PhB188]|uniref:immunoglobulin domain-containing protein n=1 Tax=Frondihabitans sp. PhB188 TaxID=2485200 RepID=UPI0011CDADC8|nr:immunoglobulin domain-containing protein [Frondihabitans sp. PhB188]